MKPLVIRSAIVASLGGLIFGFDTAVISGTTDSLKTVFHLDDAGLGFTVAIALIGTIVGALGAGNRSDGSAANGAFAIGVLYIVGALGSASTEQPGGVHIFRFLGGIGVGRPRCAPHLHRRDSPPAVSWSAGRPGAVQHRARHPARRTCSNFIILQVTGHSGQRLAMDVRRDGRARRRSSCSCSSPFRRHRATCCRWAATPRARRWHAGWPPPIEEADVVISEIHAALDAAENAPNVPFFTKSHSKVILLAVAIAMFNQLSGINAVLYYAPEVMKQAGAAGDTAFLMSCRGGPDQPDRDDGRADRHRPVRPPQPDDGRFDRLHRQPRLPGLG